MSSRYQQVLNKEQRWKKWLSRRMPDYRFSNDIYENAVKERLAENVRWIDLGCGKNELVEEFRGYKATAFGLDCEIHPQMSGHDAIRFVQGNVEKLPFKSNSLDLLSSNVLMEHLPDPGRALKEMHCCLKPGGFLIFRTPNARHLLNVLLKMVPDGLKKKLIKKIFGIFPEDVFPTYYQANRLRDLNDLCRKAGFEEYHIQPIEDIHTAFSFFFFLSLLYYRLVRFRPFASLRTNFVVIARKT